MQQVTMQFFLQSRSQLQPQITVQATLPAASTKTLTAAWLEVFDEIPFT